MTIVGVINAAVTYGLGLAFRRDYLARIFEVKVCAPDSEARS
jgi:hypothetical protein